MLSTEYLQYRNDNNEVMNIGYNYDLIPIEFTDNLDNEIHTTKFALQHGSTYASSTLDDRVIEITAVYAITDADATEAAIKRVFNPIMGGTLYKHSAAGTRKIAVRLECIPEIKRKTGIAEVTISLVALSPFYEEGARSEVLAKETALCFFPLDFVDHRVFGVRVEAVETEIENRGDIEIGFIVHFKAKDTVKNPKIINNLTGELIATINCELAKDDTLDIINLPYNKMVLKNGVKAFNLIDLDDTKFFSLLVGKNKIGIDAELNLSNLETLIEYTEQYL